MGNYKTPGVYVQEIDAYPNSVVGVSTSVPVFVGHTKRHGEAGVPKFGRITSLDQFLEVFGGPPLVKIGWEGDNGNETCTLPDAERYRLYDAVRMFFDNGGSAAWITSAGDYETTPTKTTLAEIFGRNSALERQQEPSIIVIPDAMALDSAQNAAELYQTAMMFCERHQSMITIVDIYRPAGNPISAVSDFRLHIGGAALDYGAAYYPWAHTSLYQKGDISPENCEQVLWDHLKAVLSNNEDFAPLPRQIEEAIAVDPSDDDDVAERAKKLDRSKKIKALHRQAMNLPEYAKVFEEMRRLMNVQPVAGAVAGLYARSDRSRGYWYAPAGVTASITGLAAPTIQVTHDEQADLNAPVNGLAINVIRTFPDIGSRVFGARTLDANSLDFRYVNVRRTMIFIEMSVKLALKAYVFEPNTASTQASAKSMVENFLMNQWTAGALTGTTASEAYVVRVGEAAGQTEIDTANGVMKMLVGLRPSRPAEFIELRFTQQVQV